MPPGRLFDPVVPPERRHPNFALLGDPRWAEPTGLMMEEVFASMRAADRNFVEQFQTTGFDARVFELFLHAYFTSIGAHIERAGARPDFLLTRDGLTVAVEATTANPTQAGGAPTAPITGVDVRAVAEEDAHARVERANNEIPIRLGSALFSKLGSRYWELPHVRGRPLVFAIQPFHAHDAPTFSSSSGAQYLYGVRQTGRHDDHGRLVIDTEPVATHRVGAKEVPSNFFAQPGAEHVSAVLYTNAGTASKFTRMGYQAGLHRGNLILLRRGVTWDLSPDAAEPVKFAYRLDEAVEDEPWGSGVEVFHNPRALHPISDEFFADAAQTRLEGGAPVTRSPPFAPFVSFTQRFRLNDESLRPVGDDPGGVGTILRREFDARRFAARPAPGTVPISEVAWFADGSRRAVGAVLRWHGRERYGFVVLAPGTDGVWATLEVREDYGSLDAAARAVTAHIRQTVGSA